jgi:hypothetical protein
VRAAKHLTKYLDPVTPSHLLASTLLRLELGIPRDLLDLARFCRGRLSRAEYLRLRTVGLGTLDTLANTRMDHLAEHFRRE